MKNDFDMIIRHIPERKNIRILPVADLHLGASEFRQKAWAEFVEEVKGRDDTYIILAGDLINNAIKTSVSNVYEETMRPREQKRMIADMLMPIRDKILCGVPGNHERRNKDTDDDPFYDIMCKLDLEDLYRENLAFLKIQIGDIKGAGQSNPTYTFCVAHGSGGSMYVGASASAAERFGMAIDGIDCLVVGHTHKPADLPIGKIKVDPHNNRVSLKNWRIVVCSSWLNYAGYAGQKLLTPTASVAQEILLSGTSKHLRVLQ